MSDSSRLEHMFEDGVSGDPGLGEVPDPARVRTGPAGDARLWDARSPVDVDSSTCRSVADPPAAVALADEVLAAARALAGVVGGAHEGPVRARVLGRLRELDGIVATVRGALLLAERADDRWRRPGIPTFEAALAARSRSGPGSARREVRQAEALAALPAVADAVGAGVMPVGHVDVVARVVAEASPEVKALLTSERGQADLVGMACEQDQPTFSRTLARWVAAQDPAGHEADHQAQRRERFLHLSDQVDGTHIRGRLDRMTGHVLRLALEAVGEAPGPDRSPEQARADALGTLAEKALAFPETGSGAAVRPHVSLLMSEETWVGLRALRDPVGGIARDGGFPEAFEADGSRGGAVHPASAAPPATAPRAPEVRMPPVVPPVTLEDGTPVPVSEALRILCDCELTRIVVDADSQPVDLGRTARLYTGVQRRAVIARDRHCVWPGCSAAARWCEIHHIRWWERDGGTTSLENGALLCVFHHHEVHALDLTIERRPGAPPGSRGGADAGSAVGYVFRRAGGEVVARSTVPTRSLLGDEQTAEAPLGRERRARVAMPDADGRVERPTVRADRSGPPGRSEPSTGPPARAPLMPPSGSDQPALDLSPVADRC